MVVESLRRRGRPKLRWEDRLKQDMKELLLSEDMTSDRNAWRDRIRISWAVNSSELHNISTVDINISVNTSSMVSSSFSPIIFGCALTELMELSVETKIPKFMKFFFMQQIAEEKSFANLLRNQANDVRRRLTKRENDKLSSLTQLLDEVKDGIHEKERHVDIMDLAD
ncbi:hypothetical protein Tco_1194439 [Tanacetum coccineum]